MSQLRKDVLKYFKKLHYVRKQVFKGDERALAEARLQINDNFKSNKNVSKPEDIEKLIKLAKDVEIELKTNVLQAVEKEPGVFHLQVTEHTPLLDNVLFNEKAILEGIKKGACGSKKKGK